MTSLRMLPAMDVHQYNEEHEQQYYISKNKYPTDSSNDPFELFICPYDPNHKITAKKWNKHLNGDRKKYGGNFKTCMFNASHHIPEPAYEYHMTTCPDQHIIRKGLEETSWKLATSVNHNPDWQQPDTGDNWEDEIDDNAQEFSINVSKGMPLAMLPKYGAVATEGEEEFYDHVDDENEPEEIEEVYEEYVNIDSTSSSSVLREELIPEKPLNWNDMSKTQKKNHKRKYERQQQRMAEEGVTEEHFQPETDPTKWTEEKRKTKLNAVKAAYPVAVNKMMATQFDFTSLLNIVCQKTRLNLPTYKECAPGSQGGFAYECRIRDKTYVGLDYCSTKKDAKHSCAKWALLSMDISGLDGSSHTRAKPIHPSLRAHSAKLREDDELGRLMTAGTYPQKKATVSPLRRPQIQNQAQTQSSSNLNYEQTGQPRQQQWQQHSPLPPPPQQQQQNGVQPWQQSGVVGNRVTAASTLSNNMQYMNLDNNKEFPSLEAWTTVTKKGVATAGPRSRGRGRGRGTAMKL